MGFEVVNDDSIPQVKLPFSPATRAAGLVFVSGQASVDKDGNIVKDTFAAEVRRSFENVRTILKAAGLDLSDVVRVCSYVGDAAKLGEYNEIYREFFKEPYPARTTIVNCLPDIIQFEVDVVAAER